MITWPALCPAGNTFWNKIPKSWLPIYRISSSFFALHLLASLKATECSTGPFHRTNISKLNFASGRTGGTAGAASSTLVKLSLIIDYLPSHKSIRLFLQMRIIDFLQTIDFSPSLIQGKKWKCGVFLPKWRVDRFNDTQK